MGLSTTFILAIGFGLTLSLLYEAAVPGVGTYGVTYENEDYSVIVSGNFFCRTAALVRASSEV